MGWLFVIKGAHTTAGYIVPGWAEFLSSIDCMAAEAPLSNKRNTTITRAKRELNVSCKWVICI
jgi:hypothetical protein